VVVYVSSPVPDPPDTKKVPVVSTPRLAGREAKTKLDWKPEYTFQQLVEEMCEYDLKKAMEKKNEYAY
jgi:nucleoside-diphosphate-sugar epimerase